MKLRKNISLTSSIKKMKYRFNHTYLNMLKVLYKYSI